MKIRTVGISLLLLFACSVIGQTASLSINYNEEQNADSVINFKIICDEIDGKVSTLQWYFKFDPEVLTPAGVVNYHDKLPFHEWMNNLEYGEGIIILTWLDKEARNFDIPAGEVLCELQFKYDGGKTSLDWKKENEGMYLEKNIYSAMWTEEGTKYTLNLKDCVFGTE